MLRLITIPISHYCEKARWALERAGIAYREERHVQAIHRIAVRRAGGAKTVPVLVTPEGPVSDSADILAWVDERTPSEHRLYPQDDGERRETNDLCRRLDAELGPRGRRLLYVHVFPQRELALEFNNQGVPRWEGQAIRYGWPLAQRVISSVLGIRPGIEVQDEAAVWREFDFVADLRTDGRPYLCSERFGAADLTFASLAAPLVIPPGYGVALPRLEDLTPAMESLVRCAREHPAGAYALELFAKHRHVPVV